MSLIKKASQIFHEEGPISLVHSGKNFIGRKIERRVGDRIEKRIERQLVPYTQNIAYRYQYGQAAPQADQLIRINPLEVNFLLSPHFWERVSRFSTHVRDGDWDKNYTSKQVVVSGRHEGISTPSLINFSNFKLYTSARRHFQENVPWENTELYELLHDNTDLYWEKYDSKKNINQTLEEIDILYKQIKQHGYLTQKEIQNTCQSSSPLAMNRLPPNYHEVAINIGRNGELIFDDGRHRFVVAKILGVTNIPVRVLVRHKKWQDLRYEITQANSYDQLSSETRKHLGHPDLEDIVPESWESSS